MSFKNKSETIDSKQSKGFSKKFVLNQDSPVTLQEIDDDETYKSWKDVSIPKKVIVFSFRVPKKDMQQLKYISERTGLSINAICLMAIQANNRKVLKEFEEH